MVHRPVSVRMQSFSQIGPCRLRLGSKIFFSNFCPKSTQNDPKRSLVKQFFINSQNCASYEFLNFAQRLLEKSGTVLKSQLRSPKVKIQKSGKAFFGSVSGLPSAHSLNPELFVAASQISIEKCEKQPKMNETATLRSYNFATRT